MAETVNTLGRLCAALMLALALPAVVHAQALRDPTKPPARAGVAAPGATAAENEGAPQLQSVLAARGGRRVAVIDGQAVRVGDSFRGARVTRIGDNQVELTRGRERQLLRLQAPGQPGDPGAAPRAATQTDRD